MPQTRASFKNFINAVDELGGLDGEAVAAAVTGGVNYDALLPVSQRVHIAVKRGAKDQQDVHEWGWAVFDRHFDPLRAWRLEVSWVSWAGVKVAEFLQRLASRARAHGFLLLEIPVDGNAVAGDAGNTLSPAPISFVCATAFGRRLVEHKLTHQPGKFGFRCDRRLPVAMSSLSLGGALGSTSGGADAMSSQLDPLNSPVSLPWSGCRTHVPRNLMEDDFDTEQLLIASHQRLCLALLACRAAVSVSPDPLENPFVTTTAVSAAPLLGGGRNGCNTLADMVLRRYAWMDMLGDDQLVQAIAGKIPNACDTKTTERAVADHPELALGGPAAAREERLLLQSMPVQFLHESGGALVGSGRCGADEELNRTLRWVDLATAGGGGGRGARVRGSPKEGVRDEARTELERAVEVVNICDAMVRELIDNLSMVLITKEIKL